MKIVNLRSFFVNPFQTVIAFGIVSPSEDIRDVPTVAFHLFTPQMTGERSLHCLKPFAFALTTFAGHYAYGPTHLFHTCSHKYIPNLFSAKFIKRQLYKRSTNNWNKFVCHCKSQNQNFIKNSCFKNKNYLVTCLYVTFEAPCIFI